jgi:hypothetical protein
MVINAGKYWAEAVNFCMPRERVELQTRYGLKNAVGDNRRNAITLSRVAMAFPWLACIYSLHSENPVVTNATMQQYIPVYPRAMLCNAMLEGWQILVLGSVELLLQVVEVDHRLLVELLVT